MSLDTILQRADIWRGGEHSLHDRSPAGRALATGNGELDAQLPDGGWPLGALTELLLEQPGIGELRLLLPALARLTRTGCWLAWVAPPHLPYAPALAAAGVELSRLLLIQPASAGEGLWAMEQALRAGSCGAVLGWPPAVDHRRLRRLQLAAQAGNAMGVLFRPLSARGQASPAALRLHLEPGPAGTTLHILKRRGGWVTRPVVLPREA